MGVLTVTRRRRAVEGKVRHDDLIFLTQQQVAEMLGMKRGDLWHLERRALEKIRAAIEHEAAQAGLTVQTWLFGEE